MPKPSAQRRQVSNDWTVDPTSGLANSSTDFASLAGAIDELITSHANASSQAGSITTGRLILAQLAHLHGLAPTGFRPVSLSAVEKLDGVLSGTMQLDGIYYKFTAKRE
jgi:hypothetical protein